MGLPSTSEVGIGDVAALSRPHALLRCRCFCCFDCVLSAETKEAKSRLGAAGVISCILLCRHMRWREELDVLEGINLVQLLRTRARFIRRYFRPCFLLYCWAACISRQSQTSPPPSRQRQQHNFDCCIR